MPYLPDNFKAVLQRKLGELNSLRPLPPPAVRKLRSQFEIEMTYNSNAIEGNTLSLKETYLVINEGMTVKGKSLKDHLEAKDHFAALEFLYDLIEEGKRHTMSEHLVRTLHQLIVHETDKEWAGRYRESEVMIGGSDHSPPDALEVPSKMRELISWLRTMSGKMHVVEFAALFHHRLVHIHPFLDGNGRTARLAMNLLLMQAGYPLVIILRNDRKKYYSVLSQADKGNVAPLVLFIGQAVERSLNIYLKTLTPSSKRREKYVSLSEISEKTSYSAKYLNLLARQGKLEAHKQGRNWLSSMEAVERYVRNRKRRR